MLSPESEFCIGLLRIGDNLNINSKEGVLFGIQKGKKA